MPVLSEQMTVVLPRVSTAGNRRMMALRRAIRATPMASVTVSTAGRPSGIMATARATAAMNRSTHGSPCRSPTPKVTAASARIAYSRMWLKRAILRVSGVARTSAVAISSEMRPISVSSPVAVTTPTPVP